MSPGAVLVTFAVVMVGASLIIALLFHFWPRYGSVDAALEEADHAFEELEKATAEH
jgi:hypothetical protein